MSTTLYCGEHYLRAQSSLFISKICYFTIFLSPCLFVLLFLIHIRMTVFICRNYFSTILSLPRLLLNIRVPQLHFSSGVLRLKTQKNFNIGFFFLFMKIRIYSSKFVSKISSKRQNKTVICLNHSSIVKS